jgi:hypothetical protein
MNLDGGNNIEINGNIGLGLLKYCDENNIDFRKIVEESIVQNQLRHNIDQEGNIYNITNDQKLNQSIFHEFLKKIFCKDNGNIKEMIFGKIYENISIGNYKYIIFEYRNYYKIVIITSDEKTIYLIKENDELKNIRIEENQGYSWITTYETKVLYEEIENSKIILINKE